MKKIKKQKLNFKTISGLIFDGTKTNEERALRAYYIFSCVGELIGNIDGKKRVKDLTKELLADVQPVKLCKHKGE